MPGERIDIHDGRVFVDGRRLLEPYVSSKVSTTSGTVTFLVPVGSVFVLGDDRANSWHSRAYGPVPLQNLFGQAWLGYYPLTSVAFLTTSNDLPSR